MLINHSEIVTTRKTQHRHINPDVVAHYASLMRDGVEFPPILVCYVDNQECVLVDGFHRRAASLSNGDDTIDAEITYGDIKDAVLLSYGANKKNGLQRENLSQLLKDFFSDARTDAWEMTEQEVAKLIGCSRQLVNKVKGDFSLDEENTVGNVLSQKGNFDDVADEIIEEDEEESECEEIDKQDQVSQKLPMVAIPDLASPDYELGATAIKSALTSIDASLKVLENLTGDGTEMFNKYSGSYLTAFRGNIKAMRRFIPVGECTVCCGDGCALCHDLGYITQMDIDITPELAV